MLRNVAVVVVSGFLPFEFGTVCEVFGVDRSDDGLPRYDFAVVAGEPPPLRALDFTIQPSHGLERLDQADLIALPAVSDERLRRDAKGYPRPARRAYCDRVCPPRSVSVPSRPPAASSRPVLGPPAASGTQVASAARIMSGHGHGAGFGRTSSDSQSGTTAARIAAARVLIRARLRSSLIAAPPRRRFLPNGSW